MIWFAVFFALVGASVIATWRFVPSEHLQIYAQARKDLTYWAAAGLWNGIWATAAFQLVFSPVECPLLIRMIGIALLIAGQALIISARRVNDLFVPNLVYVPLKWRVRTGPYRFLAHPGYVGFILSAVGAACLLGSPWAGFPACAYTGLMIGRMFIEDRMLSGKHLS
jgi:protein-S-isoprenylcysteine O-methyltransferase Ste14